MSWITNLFGKTSGYPLLEKEREEKLEEKLKDLKEVVAANHAESTKSARRLSLGQRQIIESNGKLESLVSDLRLNLVQKHGFTFTSQELFELLDSVQKISIVCNNASDSGENELAKKLVNNLGAKIMDQTQLVPIAHLNQSFPEIGCDVISVVPSEFEESGIVKEIVQQGFVLPGGKILRHAKVFVTGNNQ